jgi:type II secretory pathway pseudopilin PulG
MLMRKRFFDKQLRLHCSRAARRRGFSLAELVVSVGILVLLMALAGQVMSLTVQSTGQAKAITEVNQQLRIFEQSVREDLRYVRPGESVIVIQGNPINAYWTQDHMEADGTGNPRLQRLPNIEPEYEDPYAPDTMVQPRADVLMFFTARAATSHVHPGVSTNVQQVIYGHANLGAYTAGGSFTPDPLGAFPDDPDVVFGIPAEEWHLARRSVLLSPNDPMTFLVDPEPPPLRLDDERLLRGATDVIEVFSYEERVLTPVPESEGGGYPWYLPRIFEPPVGAARAMPFARSLLDLTPPPTVAYAVNQFFLSNCASFQVEWAPDPHSDFVGGRLDGEMQVYWFDPGALADPADLTSQPDPLSKLREEMLAASGDREERLHSLLEDRLGGRGIQLYSLDERFGPPPTDWIDEAPWLYSAAVVRQRPNIAVFTAARREPPWGGQPGAIVPEDIFPAALRITIDVYDRERRLDRPVRHVFVVPIGE